MKAILLTGPPGCGKTTLIQRLIPYLPPPVHGFYTQEIRQAAEPGLKGQRVGFELITLDGRSGLLAHVDPAQIEGTTRPRIGRYIVNLHALEALAVPTLDDAISKGGWAVILLGSIVRRSTPFGDQIKARSDVALIEISPKNRASLLEHLLALIKQ
jgi:nucleoside-triphosphatase